jgi:peptidoglycan glycosyltransferase
MKKKVIRRNINLIQFIFIGLFFLLIGNLVYFNIAKSSAVIINPYNPRLDLLEDTVVRGNILSSDGEVLAESVRLKDKSYERVYPYGNIFAHIVGFATRGKSGLESYTNYDLLTSRVNPFEKLWNEISGEKNPGNNVITTLDTELQTIAHQALGKNKGSIVVMDPSTGKILAMVSKPDFDPNEIDLLWDQVIQKNPEDTFLLNRATQGTYPPGSTFKILTALFYMIENPNWQDFSYTCTGKDRFFDNDISCYGNTAHGEVDLQSALAVSCNTAFAQIGTTLDLDKFKSFTEKFLFNQELPYPLNYTRSSYVLDSQSPLEVVPETVIGQGQIEITPLHNALITSAIANGGLLMKPYLVDRIETANGSLVRKNMPEQFKRIITSQEAFMITELMEQVVTEGTGRGLNNLPFTVAGKTGSAEFKKGEKPHAWFVGFAPVDQPKIVVSIIVENVGTSSQFAVPIAYEIFSNYLSR